MTKRDSFPFFFLFFVLMLPCILAGSMRKDAGIAELDDYWKENAHNASKAAIAAYRTDPVSVTANFTKEVHETLSSTNSTRRSLKGGGGGENGCKAENPIDRCWRCRPDWAEHRKDLAKCARGFGEGTTGGADGPFYVVTDPSDDDVTNPKEGTIRWAVIQEEPLWIIFEKNMVITLQQELMIASDKTIDGRGVEVRFTGGAGLTLQFVNNIIITNIRVHNISAKAGGMVRDKRSHCGMRTRSDGDGISLFGATRVWIDHVSLERCEDGLIDAIMASTAVTISNCKLNNHNDVMLLGAADGYEGDQIMQVTVAFNKFGRNLTQRMPRCRWGFFHVVNNDYQRWTMYAIGGSMHPTIISEGNHFKAPNDIRAKEVTHRDHAVESEWRNWHWKSINDKFENGAFFVDSGGETIINQNRRDHMVQAKTGDAVVRLTRYSGALKCVVGKPC